MKILAFQFAPSGRPFLSDASKHSSLIFVATTAFAAHPYQVLHPFQQIQAFSPQLLCFDT